MTTLEKLFAQIFERKDMIIEQIQQQADSYSQQLASTLLIDGFTPPPWLLSPNFNSRSSDPNELEKEKIISKLLLRPPRDSSRYSTGGCSLYYRPVAAGGNERLSNVMCMENRTFNKALNVSSEPTVTRDSNEIACLNCVPELDDNVKSPLNEVGARTSSIYAAPDMSIECHNNDTVCSLSRVGERDDSVESPQNETNARITSIYAAPEMSLARIQRSKSRQKARELRTNVKATSKSCLSNENRTHISFSGDSKSKKDIHQVTQDKCLSEVDKCKDISGAITMTAEEKGDKANNRTSHNCTLAKSSSSYEKLRTSKRGSSSDKETLDGGIMVQPTGDSLQQYGHVNGVMEGANLSHFCLGSYDSKKSRTRKTQGTQSKNKPFCGRVTRSRSSNQQISRINKSSNTGTSVSCNPKEGGGALSHSVGDLMHKLNVSNKLLDAVKTSQVLSDRNGETQVICSNGGILKPVISSNMDMKKSSLGGNHQENAENAVGNGPIYAPLVMMPVNSGSKMDPVTSDCFMKVKPKQLNFDEIGECDLNEICSPLSKKRKQDGLLGQERYPSKVSASSVDHKYSNNLFEQQLPKANILSSRPKAARTESYNNTDECAKYEMMNIGLETIENPVVEDVEHNSKVSLQDDSNVACEVNISSKEVDNIFNEEMHSEKPHLKEDHTSSLKMQIKEGDLGHKGEESASGVFIPVSQNSKSSFISSLTKQGNKDFEVDLGSSKDFEVGLGSSNSKDFEVGTTLKLSSMKLNSAKFSICPLNQQKNVEYQPNCFSDSRKFMAHIQRDAIPLNLKTPENDLNSTKESASILSSKKVSISQSDGIQSCNKSFHNEMICDLPEGTESLHELQAAEVIVTEMNDDTTVTTDTLKQSEPTSVLNTIKNATDVGPVNPIINDEDVVADNNKFEINLPEWVSSYDSVQPVQNDDKTMDVSDEITPVYEGFIIDEKTRSLNMKNNEGGIDFDTLEVPSTIIARAGIIEQICKSASMQTPLSQFSSALKQHQIQDLYGFMADGNHGILDHMDIGTTLSLDEDSRKHLQTSGSCITEIDSVFPQHQKFSYATPFWQSKNHYSSPTGKPWERSASSSGSSEKQLCSNPDLTCFPIEEDPNSNEESENAEAASDELQENIISKIENEKSTKVSPKMKTERTENDDEVVVEIQERLHESTEVWSQLANHVPTKSMKYPDRCSSNSVNIEVSVPRTRDKVKHKPKFHHGFKASTYDEESRSSSIITHASSRGILSEINRNKSSMRSGIPRLSQKEAKRNNIVSNITSFIPIVQQKQAAAVCTGKRDIKVKALEAAEAAKRCEQNKENERRMKKEALKLERARIGKENAKEMELNLIKKQEELKKKEADIAARKRLREEEERKQMAKRRKLAAEAQKIQKIKLEKLRARKVEIEKHAAVAGNKTKSENMIQNKIANENSVKKQDSELRTNKTLANVVQHVTYVLENIDASSDCGEKEKATCVQEKSPVKIGPMKLSIQENSYDISPYQCSDDEDDEEDDLPTKKFVPSWASKNRVAMVLPLQQKLDPESIFSVDSFCSMDEVLLPRRLQGQ
ncbi:hypothetical protein L1987_55742 [Smallanthus sonchifolius]|uniref:Uncharacterized protein n=1 Tax=Smallanthus sonchifolius TaxID=185202 RepID=A0ACB9EAV3_9ASTR|nr:hypothetical protein L1987_55742 [Smallanthus sonchifolius]